MKTIDRINIHKKQTQHDIHSKRNNIQRTGNIFYVAKGGGATPLIISASKCNMLFLCHNRTNIIYDNFCVTNIKYIMYNVQD